MSYTFNGSLLLIISWLGVVWIGMEWKGMPSESLWPIDLTFPTISQAIVSSWSASYFFSSSNTALKIIMGPWLGRVEEANIIMLPHEDRQTDTPLVTWILCCLPLGYTCCLYRYWSSSLCAHIGIWGNKRRGWESNRELYGQSLSFAARHDTPKLRGRNAMEQQQPKKYHHTFSIEQRERDRDR